MKQKSIAVVGAAETTEMGRIPDVSVMGLHAEAMPPNAVRALVSALWDGLNPQAGALA